MKNNKDVRVGVGVIIVRNNQILLGERIGSHGANTWATPGGHLEMGECIEACAKREVLEETGLSLDSVKKLGFTNDIFEAEDKHYVTLFVISSSQEGEAQVREPNKCKQWQWFNFNALPQPLFLPLINLLKENPEFNGVF
ncbi:nucleotide triphosphate diphosphatase NUDT15 [Pseudoalteromonas denitrificans]|uniref:8-oxo-dGTP diphosphatase n=1 Tax=Pseudoalteromonas denitrificans DSM 6059 TaxID=1123010 RepID=A0A1I1QZ80_9GAMM|nr:NUDIX hydrolase [Pseudoalteromonas denitrificans]SFD27379.1 8-oxo-dGTP diphosphatase [Pseudoalteromonas denitrificans DSM 6059]